LLLRSRLPFAVEPCLMLQAVSSLIFGNEPSKMDIEVEKVLEAFIDVQDDIERSNKIKDKANDYFKKQDYDMAIELYTAAVDAAPSAVLYGNRSMAYLKKELYGSALNDADSALAIDNNYIKGYYRRATANMALGRFKKALKDYEIAKKHAPNDKDALAKFNECSKIVKRINFEKAIAGEDMKKSVVLSLNLNDMEVESSYEGPHLGETITREFVDKMIVHFKAQKKIHKKYAFKILIEIRKWFMAQPTLVDITVPDGNKFTICGDVHGQFYDLCNIFDLNGAPSETNPYLFNGDFVDRGSFSVETIFTMFAYKLLLPNHFFMSRGNHESDVMNKMYGFEGEVKNKYSAQMCELFTELFNYLPLCHLINQKVFVCHGGLFKQEGVTLDDIRKTDRVRQPPDEGIMCDLLWSDPYSINGRSPSKRGVGCQFGPDVSETWCKENGVDYVVRSHEVKVEGWEEHHNGRVYTVFSAPNYCDQMGNKGAFITIKGDNLTPRFTSFSEVSHPTVPPMAYASSLFGFM
ncbi:hypothetical protein PFISCL1PPCAC_2248, partial [Pristionchus fissidentatus]